ncbi:MAG: SRPBCC domain-containing protein [Planctomycetes bacterium]|nr:SRPBCC domain-containing protein [Planctomycetota bacterium]
MKAMLSILLTLGAALAQQAPTRSLVHQAVIKTSAANLWADFTTDAGVVKAWGVAKAKVDLRVGGTIRTHYDKNGTIGDPNTITHHILAVEPGRVLAMKAEAPANAPAAVKLICEHGWNVMRFEPLGPDRVRFVVTGCGYGDSKDFDAAMKFFDEGNRWTMQRMQQTYAKTADPSDPSAVERLLDPIVGGTWQADGERQDPAAAFRIEAERWLPSAVEIRMWAPAAGRAVAPAGKIVVQRDADADVVAFTAWDAQGQLVRGHLRVPAAGVLEFAGAVVAADGGSAPRLLTLRPNADGVAWDGPEGRWQLTRADKVPAKLR